MHRSRDAGTWNSIRAAGREETKNPPCQSARRVSENLPRNSKSSLAVFYVEQVALNRHVSPQLQLTLLCLSGCPMSRGRWDKAWVESLGQAVKLHRDDEVAAPPTPPI